MAWSFEPGEALHDAFRRVAAEEVARVRESLEDRDADRSNAIHGARQGFKRLRALLRLAEPALGPDRKTADRLLRDAGRRLSGLRDGTVRAEAFNEIVEGNGVDAPKREIGRLRVSVVGSGAQGDIEPNVADALKLLGLAGAALDRLEWPERRGELRRGLEKSQSRLRKSWKKARDEADSGAFHAWRKRVKDQAAQLRLFRRILPAGLRQRRDEEKATAELLGKEHDLGLLLDRLPEGTLSPGMSSARRAFGDAIVSRRGALQRDALAAGAAFSCVQPKAFAREVASAWEKGSKKTPRKTVQPSG